MVIWGIYWVRRDLFVVFVLFLAVGIISSIFVLFLTREG